MNILMIAPEPFFQPRGTPISVYFRTTALGELGHRTDLFTYPLGEDVAIKNLRIFRAPNILGLRRIKIGPSLVKIPLDALLFLRASFALCRRRYDLVFTHEEAALIGLVLSKVWRLPHIYDMHSSLPQQLENFEFSRSRLLKRLFVRMERLILRTSHAVIVICQDLLDTVRREGFGDKAVLIENVLDFPAADVTPEEAAEVRRRAAPGGERIVLYAGNFGPYQGIELLLEAFARVREKAVLVLVGGSGEDLEKMKARSAELGLGGRVVFRNGSLRSGCRSLSLSPTSSFRRGSRERTRRSRSTRTSSPGSPWWRRTSIPTPRSFMRGSPSSSSRRPREWRRG
jgi:glycosyltransferase involved in cell wall biosynthesis